MERALKNDLVKNLKKNTTPCLTCKSLKCRDKGIDCYGIKESSLVAYSDKMVLLKTKSASGLIDNGRAGSLSRVEEVIEFCKAEKYSRIGIAYCFGLKDMAMEVCDKLQNAGLIPLPVSCTSGAVKERHLDVSKKTETVSCNPVGQALVLNKLKPDLVLEMGLCMGHDVIFHQHLEIPHSVLLVKDRVFAHSPAKFLSAHKDKNAQFLESLDNSFAMKPPAWLVEQLYSDEKLNIIDLRGEEAFKKAHIKGAINIQLKNLPDIAPKLDKTLTTVCVCNGSVQSAYGVMFLHGRGYEEVYNLSGGMSRWEKEELPVE
ncbi:MAG: DUF1847 domain-containing protein [Deltaproteobacteria bacterium]|nr:DUF1847 domain-containing protein [Deltaproteobacteria bacterium]